MTPHEQSMILTPAADYPTSPWTEVYQAAPASQHESADADDEAVQHVRNALFEAFNR